MPKAVILVAILMFIALPASAQTPTSDFSRCLVENISPAQKDDFARWMFAAMAHHPGVTSIANVSEEDTVKANQAAAKLFETMITDTCAEPFSKAVEHNGRAAFEIGFAAMGEIAGREAFNHSEVNRYIFGMTQYLNREKVQAAMETSD